MTISMVNKLILSSYEFKGTFILLGCQLAGALAFVGLFKLMNEFGIGEGVVPKIPSFEVAKLKKAWLIAALTVGNVGCAFFGLRIVNVPLFLCVRRLTTVCVMITQYIMLGTTQSNSVMSAVGLIMLGTILTGYETLSDNYLGYLFVMGNNILTSIHYVAQKKYIDETKLESFGLLYYNALIALPLCVITAWYLGEFETLAEYPHLNDPGFHFGMICSSALGVLMTYAIVLCNTVNSPLATATTGNVKDLGSSVIGWVLFGGFVATTSSILGLLLSFLGAGYYSYLKLQGMQNKPAPEIEKDNELTRVAPISPSGSVGESEALIAGKKG